MKIKREEGRTRNKKWGILKYLFAEISFEKSKIIPDQRTCVSGVLGQKLGYDNIVNLKISNANCLDETTISVDMILYLHFITS